ALLGMFGDWSEGGSTTATDIIGFLTDIGAKTDELVLTEEENTAQMITSWEEQQASLSTSTDDMIGTHGLMEGSGSQLETTLSENYAGISSEGVLLADNISDSVSIAMGGFVEFESGANAMASTFSSDANEVILRTGLIQKAIDRLPPVTTLKIVVEVDAPEGFEFGSPEFKFFYALQKLVEYAEENEISISANLLDAAGVFSGLGSAAMGLYKKRVMEPLKDMITGIDDEIKGLIGDLGGIEKEIEGIQKQIEDTLKQMDATL
ncbi:unnamed protein product, partial [marine sediment metagenome]